MRICDSCGQPLKADHHRIDVHVGGDWSRSYVAGTFCGTKCYLDASRAGVFARLVAGIDPEEAEIPGNDLGRPGSNLGQIA